MMATMRLDATGRASFPTRRTPVRSRVRRRREVLTCSSSASASSERPMHQQRLIQHKEEAYWFYRFLSIVYDHIVNPGHWTEDMRKEALEPAQLDRRDLKVYDVGGGTGFCTLGIVEHVDGKHVTLLDQSPHQLAKAKAKSALQDVTILEGDAEDLPFENDSTDRYVSAGSIEYWPEPQRGICEAYRVLKPGPKMESRQAEFNPMVFLPRLVLGTAAGFYYFVLPIYMFLKNILIGGLEKIYPKAASWM
eukprot:jgi/Pico_ML_1/52466/g3167.t1